ncbi:FHA domain-containing protein [Nannocystaceae bacterium ST9]
MSVQYRLKIGARTLKLPEGKLDVGRMADCWLTLEDDLASRYHARFHVEPERLELEDLGSRNGTYVNGEPLKGKIVLQHGDKIRIGSEVISILGPEGEDEDDSTDALRRTIGPGEKSQFPALIGQLVEKSLSMGKIKEAERYATALVNQIVAAKVGVDHPNAVSAASCLLALAEKTSSGVWLDRLFRLHAANRWIMSEVSLERVRGALDRIPRVPGSGLSDYEVMLRSMAREGIEVSPKLMATIGELADAYGRG